MASSHVLRIKGSIPAKYIPKRKLKNRHGAFGYHRTNHFTFIPGDPEFKIEDFMMYSEPDEEETSNSGLLNENREQTAAAGVGRASSSDLYSNSFYETNAALSFNLADYVMYREIGAARTEKRSINVEYGTRHLLTTGMLKERSISLNGVNKVFCSQWLNDNQIVMGTRCNKLLVYNVNNRNLDVIPTLTSSESVSRNRDQKTGIHAVKINSSKTMLATGAQNSSDLAVYRLPTMDPICVGEKAHTEWILDLCWLDDYTIVTGSTDGKMALWSVRDSCEEKEDQESVSNYSRIKPIKVKKCFGADKIRAITYNPSMNEIVALSMNAYIHVWDSNKFWQKMSRKLPHAMENACLTMREDGSLYAIGSKSHFTLLDPRTLHHIKKVNARVSGCSVRSITFHKDILTIGTGIGVIMVYDMRAGKYMESTMNSGRAVVLKSTKGWVNPDDGFHDAIRNIEHTPAIFTHCYDWSGTRLFTGGGPLDEQLKGNYAAIWC